MKKVAPLLLSLVFFFGALPYAQATTVCASFQVQTDNDLFGYSPAQYKLGQPFTVSATCTVGDVQVNVGTNNSPIDAVTVSIYSQSGGQPNVSLEQGTTIDNTLLPIGFKWVTSTFAGTLVLSPATTYYVVLGRTGAAGGAGQPVYHSGLDNTAATLGTYSQFNNVSWSTSANTGYNFDFIVESVTSVKHATGFLFKAKTFILKGIGYVI